MGTPGTDSSGWAGWAISSFTNKLATADGILQPKIVPQSNGTSIPTNATSSTAPMPHHTASKATPAFSRTATETTKLAQSFSAPEAAEEAGFWDNEIEDDKADGGVEDDDDAWGAMNDENDDEVVKSRSISEIAPRSTTKPVAPTTPLDVDSEPDFAGWLKAQQGGSKAQTRVLPKGLGTSSAKTMGGATVKKPGLVAVKATPGANAAADAVKVKAALGVVKKQAMLVVERLAEKNAVDKSVEEDDAWGAWD